MKNKKGEKMIKSIGISEFVKRQTKESQFTHFEGNWEELRDMLNDLWDRKSFLEENPGYRKGVKIISIIPSRFYTYTNFPMFSGMKIDAEWEKVPGREQEPAKLQVKIKEPKKHCKFVDIILYNKKVLKEDGDEVTGANWDVVSINGRLNNKPTPIDPMTIVRNWKHLPGGTKMKGKKPEEVLEMLCESIMYKNGIKYSK